MKILEILSPNKFLALSRKLRIFLGCATIIFLILGLYFALISSPEDYQQGIMVRVMYIHVPSAWLSLAIYLMIGFLSISYLIWSARFAFFIALAAAPIGACFCVITLLTGMFWGKPIWGTWWVWDARLTSMFILFIFYLTFLIVSSSSSNLRKVEKPSSIIAILGMINVPIVKFSVNLWYSLHQGSTFIKYGGPSLDSSMLFPLILMFFANFFLFIFLLSFRIETIYNKNRIKH